MENKEVPGTVPQSAPVTNPMQGKTIERQGASSSPMVKRYPEVRGGVCEFCGTMDRNYPSEYQYKLCQHYNGMDLRCSYCDKNKDPNEINKTLTLNVADHPVYPNHLIVWCNSYACSKKHLERYQVNK